MPASTPPPPPDQSSLYQAALDHLARYAATEAGLRRVLLRRVDRWARQQSDPDAATPLIAAARDAVETVIRRLAETGIISDTAFAESRAKTLSRSGRSNRMIQARLVAKGVAPTVARAAAETGAEEELAAALVLARKRRIGPYRAAEDADAPARLKEMGVLARAGFSRDIAQQVLSTTRVEAERHIARLRQS
jgi:regulatory protein